MYVHFKAYNYNDFFIGLDLFIAIKFKGYFLLYLKPFLLNKKFFDKCYLFYFDHRCYFSYKKASF